jgi:hypothetical protein
MRMIPTAWPLRIGIGLCILAALPAGATPTLVTDMTHQLSNVWISATAYGCTLIAAFSKTKK